MILHLPDRRESDQVVLARWAVGAAAATPLAPKSEAETRNYCHIKLRLGHIKTHETTDLVTR